MKKACPRTAKLCDPGCQACKPHGQYGTRNPSRVLVDHNRWARKLKREHPYCQRCGSTSKLDAHHGPDGGVVLCNPCHVALDRHARPR